MQEKFNVWESNLYFHNLLYDWMITDRMGLRLPTKKLHDTMMMAFHLGNLPQGLKALAYRLLGMRMEDFEDLVRPYSVGRVFDYYYKASKILWTKPEEQLVVDDKTGNWKTYKPQGLNTKLKRLFTDLSRNPDKNIFEVWSNWEMHHEELTASELGPYTGLDIADVPFVDALYYACRDSDATIRLVPKLQKMKEKAHQGLLQELWEI
jgi:hypothetical protein